MSISFFDHLITKRTFIVNLICMISTLPDIIYSATQKREFPVIIYFFDKKQLSTIFLNYFNIKIFKGGYHEDLSFLYRHFYFKYQFVLRR